MAKISFFNLAQPNFAYSAKVSRLLPIRQKSQDFCLFIKSLRHCLIKTMFYKCSMNQPLGPWLEMSAEAV
jgi:hypothetical protein